MSLRSMIKVVCIKEIVRQCHLTPSGLTNELTKGKIYEAHGSWNVQDSYVIVTDTNCISTYSKSYFVTLSEWRKLKIEELGI